ncbi:translation initiation factor IF-2-like [Mustela erminea]|uniref:translation initiation factor IF-2-like n=1 Tax=Mustela erminea TaxID=36723 RepID=UPI001386CBB5|nr:translation initiation factor IF-2-like [Mustela erminea]
MRTQTHKGEDSTRRDPPTHGRRRDHPAVQTRGRIPGIPCGPVWEHRSPQTHPSSAGCHRRPRTGHRNPQVQPPTLAGLGRAGPRPGDPSRLGPRARCGGARGRPGGGAQASQGQAGWLPPRGAERSRPPGSKFKAPGGGRCALSAPLRSGHFPLAGAPRSPRPGHPAGAAATPAPHGPGGRPLLDPRSPAGCALGGLALRAAPSRLGPEPGRRREPDLATFAGSPRTTPKTPRAKTKVGAATYHGAAARRRGRRRSERARSPARGGRRRREEAAREGARGRERAREGGGAPRPPPRPAGPSPRPALPPAPRAARASGRSAPGPRLRRLPLRLHPRPGPREGRPSKRRPRRVVGPRSMEQEMYPNFLPLWTHFTLLKVEQGIPFGGCEATKRKGDRKHRVLAHKQAEAQTLCLSLLPPLTHSGTSRALAEQLQTFRPQTIFPVGNLRAREGPRGRQESRPGHRKVSGLPTCQEDTARGALRGHATGASCAAPDRLPVSPLVTTAPHLANGRGRMAQPQLCLALRRRCPGVPESERSERQRRVPGRPRPPAAPLTIHHILAVTS